MFLPPKSTFPISPTPYTPEVRNWCSTCKRFIDHFSPIYSITGLIILGKELRQICKDCHRMGYFDYSVFRGEYPKLLSYTREDWKRIKKELYAKHPKHIAFYLYHDLRAIRYREIIWQNSDWRQQFSPREVEWLEKQISQMTKDLYCVDNTRAANIDKAGQMRRYRRQQDQGCCGSCDQDVFCWWNGKSYRIGCNHGH